MHSQPWKDARKAELLQRLIKEKILVLDGAMGTMIQPLELTEDDFRGQRFADHPLPLAGNNDLLSITQPEAIAGIHRAYLEAGADVVCTNTFNANAPSMSDYGMEDLVPELNRAAAEILCSRSRSLSCSISAAMSPS
mgnify:CR=1 FL=1